MNTFNVLVGCFFAVVTQQVLAQQYSLSDFQTNWYNASEHCRRIGLQLATITSQAEQNQVDQILGRVGMVWTWISGNDLSERGKFVWHSTGQPIAPPSYWGANQPDNAGGNERCVHLWPSAGNNQISTWNNYVCNERLYFLCETQSCCCEHIIKI